MNNKNLKLFVWEDFAPDYSRGLAFAIAQNEKEAREMVIQIYGFEPTDWGKLTISSIKRVAFAVSGGA